MHLKLTRTAVWFISLWLFSFTMNTAVAATTKYCVVLASASGSGADWSPKQSRLFDGKSLYVTEVKIKGKDWERLNLGFFDTRKQAASALPAIRKLYPGAWLKQATADDIRIASSNDINAGTARSKTRVSTGSKSNLPDKRLKQLMQDAKSAFKKGKYRLAIRYFSAITLSGDNRYSQEALELQGLSRQRNRQKSHAANIYERYLKRYPKGSDANRVRQRLAGLLTETSSAKKSIRLSSKGRIDNKGSWTNYGSFSQYYRHDATNIDAAGNITTLSQLISFADSTSIYRIGGKEHRFQITLDNTYDFLEETVSPSEFRFSALYYEFSAKNEAGSMKLGRQKLRVGGLLNRFDGISLGYQINPDFHITLLGGAPVEIDDKTSINDHKRFYGIIFDTGTFLKHWNANIFHFNQTADGVDDRINTGAEIFYRDGTNTAFGIFDYDSLFNTMNTAYVNGHTKLTADLSAHVNAFIRKSPPVSLSNALIGQTTTTIDGTLTSLGLNIEQLYQLALDRTTTTKTVTVGGTQKLNSTYQINLDATVASTDSTVASQGVPATPSTGADLFLSGQLVGNSLIVNNDTGVLGFRYYNTHSSDTLSLIMNTRFPLSRDWRIYPRIQLDHRNRRTGGTQNKTRYLFKTDYRYNRKARFDFEIGYDDTQESGSGQSLGTNSLFFSLGYRLTF